MRKQTKVLVATTLLTLGASFSAFAAKTGTWVVEDEGHMCLDKDGDPYTNEWCLYEGEEYYVGDDGIMVTSDWVEDNGDYYYVGSTGRKTINDWRYVTPVDDEDADEEWFYFGSKGKRVSSAKKVIGGKTYYFDNAGVLLTGWVNTTEFVESDVESIDNVVYCDEDGARVTKAWIEAYAPEVDEDEDDLDDYDQYWYYLGSNGKPSVGKKANIKGQTYLFNKKGQMQTGWVALDGDEYKKVGVKNQLLTIDSYDAVYFCGGSNDGHVKKNTWINEWRNTQYNAADDDNDQYWFWIEKDGKVFVPTTSDAIKAAKKYDFKEGVLVEGDGIAIATRTLNKKVYAFNELGEMVDGFVKVSDDMFYYGGSNDGSRKTGSLTIKDNCDEDYKFYFATKDEGTVYKKAVGVTGAKGGKLYEDGLLVTAEDYKYADVTVNGAKYIVNGSGTIQTTFKKYEDGDFEVDLSDKTKVSFNDGKTNAALKGSYTVSSTATAE